MYVLCSYCMSGPKLHTEKVFDDLGFRGSNFEFSGTCVQKTGYVCTNQIM